MKASDRCVRARSFAEGLTINFADFGNNSVTADC